MTTPGRWLVRWTSDSGTGCLMFVRGWPNRERPRWFTSIVVPTTSGPVVYFMPGRDVFSYWSRCGVRGNHGTGYTTVDAEGNAILVRRWRGLTEISSLNRESGPLTEWSVLVPDWMLVALTAWPPLLWLALRALRALVVGRRRRLGLCRRCGYDLTGNVSGRCSECGEAVGANGGRATA